MTSVSISLNGASPIKVIADGNISIQTLLSQCLPEIKGNIDDALVICNEKVLSKNKTLNEQQICDGAQLFVCPHTEELKNAFHHHKINDQIEQVVREALRITEQKIVRILDDPRVMRSFSTYLQTQNFGEPDYQGPPPQTDNKIMVNLLELQKQQNMKIFENTKQIPADPLPMSWKKDHSQSFYDDPQEIYFKSVSDARKYYSRQLKHGWDW